MPDAKGRGRRIFAAGARTLGRGLLKTVTRTDAGAHWAKVGEDWYQTLGELKGAAMKLGQLASQYRDLLPDEVAEQLARLQADAQPLEWSEIRNALDATWTAEHWAQIERIEPVALASASIGQVHKGSLRNGREVAIKVRYPGVADAMGADVRNLGRILRAAGLLPLDKASLNGLLEEIRERMTEEMDYARERAYIEEFADLAGLDGLVIPKVISELCTDCVLVTEFMPGHSLDTARGWSQAMRDRIGLRYVDWMIEQIFDHGLIHADPHPGNFSFRENGDIVIYDFGCVKRIQERDQRLVTEQLRAALASDWTTLHRSLGEIGSLSRPDKDLSPALETLYASSTEFFRERLMQAPHFDFADQQFIPDARAQLRQALPQWRQFKPVPELAFVARALSGGYWLVRGLGARVDLQSRLEAIAARSA